jgi:putative addiction module killer protein
MGELLVCVGLSQTAKVGRAKPATGISSLSRRRGRRQWRRRWAKTTRDCGFSTITPPGLSGRSLPSITTKQAQRGNASNVETVGEGVSELKLNWEPGYRVYFGHDGKTIVILLCGGTKKRQSRDIATAKARWADYKARKAARAR